MEQAALRRRKGHARSGQRLGPGTSPSGFFDDRGCFFNAGPGPSCSIAMSGVTAYVPERLNRRWLVADINDCSAIQERLLSFKNGLHPLWKAPDPRAQPLATASEALPA